MKISNIRVPNQVPENFKLLIVGESPGDVEEYERKPFVGASGELLINTLNSYGILRSQIALANLSQYRPEGNRFEILRGTNELSLGLYELEQIIETKKPNLVLALGAEPFSFLSGKDLDEIRISRWRGSLVKGYNNTKILASYHPSYIIRNTDKLYEFSADISRAVEQMQFPEIPALQRDFYAAPTGEQLVQLIEQYKEAKVLSVDIESVKGKTLILCVGFAISRHHSICLPFTGYYIPIIRELLNCPAKKIMHNGIFDTEMLLVNGLEVTNYCEDTFNLHHALEPELPRSLDFIASIYTYQPFYKTVGRGEIPEDTKSWNEKVDKLSLYNYNMTDCVVTYECWEEMSSRLPSDPLALRVYRNRMDTQQPMAIEVGRAGMLVDKVTNEKLLLALTYRWHKLQFALDIYYQGHCNVNSPKSVPCLVYDKMKLPVKRKRAVGKEQGSVTTDEDAIVANITFCLNKVEESKKATTKLDWQNKADILKLVLEIRGIRKALSSYIETDLSSDGRLRSTVKVSSTNTGRWAAAKYVDGTGLNSMTFPRDGFEVPDEIPESFDPKPLLAMLSKEDKEYDSAA
jgi:uracil-DNA glycosylase family 4